MRLKISPESLEAIRRHGEQDFPRECCGLLLGRLDPAGRTVLAIVPVENERPGLQRDRYFITPERLLEGELQARLKGMDVVGFYHSHPGSPALPSDADREGAWPTYSYMIVSVIRGAAREVASWTLAAGRDRFEPEEIVMSSVPPSSGLSQEEILRYSRHLIMPEVGIEGQRKLKEASVLVIGAGGLGSPVSLYLAAAGVGRLGIVDFDLVDATNLQRQILHGTSSVGHPKLESARRRLHDLNPNVRIDTHETVLTASNALNLLRDYDVIVDGTDNFPTRYLVNDACVLLGKPNVYGSIFRFEGQASVFDARRGPCYRCLYPEPPPPGMVPSCSAAGVLGVLPGLIGVIQATEAVKLILGIGENLVGRLLLVDALRMGLRELRFRKDPSCPVCGPRATIRELIDYEQFCGVPEVPPEPEAACRITPAELKLRLDRGDRLVLVDVREPHEHDICRIPGSRLIPLGQIAERMNELSPAEEIVLHCRRGLRSARALEILRQAGFARVLNLTGGIDAWARDVDPAMPRY